MKLPSLRKDLAGTGRCGGSPFSGALVIALIASLPAGCGPLLGDYPVVEEARAAEPKPAEVSRLVEDVAWLADDARQGRRAGTAGEHAAGTWLAQRLEALGLEPAGDRGWYQSFSVPLPPRDLGTSSVAVGLEGRAGGVEAKFDEPSQLVPFFCSSKGRAVGPPAFAGYGIVNEDLGWDDYGERDVEGRVVLIIRGTPPEDLLPESEAGRPVENPHGPPVTTSGPHWGSSATVFHRVMEAKRRGALGVIVGEHPDRESDLPPFDVTRAGEANVPVVVVTTAVAEAVLPGFTEAVRRGDAGDGYEDLPVGQRVVRVRAEVERASGEARNVLGRVRGRSSNGPTLLIGAHYDHLGHGGAGSLAPNAYGEVHNGADDNASGTAVVLEVARLVAQTPLAGDLVVALWSGEELGLLGSEHWAKNPTFPLASVDAYLNLDMVGRAGDGSLEVLGAGSAAELAGWLEAAGPAAGLDLKVSLSGQGVGGSDHQTFLKRSIPAVHFFSGVHTDYHKPSDDVERFEALGAARVADLCLDLLKRMSLAGDLTWVEPPKSESAPTGGRGFRTRFGSIPEYSYDGAGLMLAGTSEGGAAERAGLLKGDLIVRIDDVEIESIGDFMYVLNSHKPGDVVLTHYIRDGEERTVRVTLEGTTGE